MSFQEEYFNKMLIERHFDCHWSRSEWLSRDKHNDTLVNVIFYAR